MPDILKQPVNCDAVLVPAVLAMTQRTDVKLAVLSMTNESNYEEQKKAYAAAVPGYFDGTFDEFREKRSSLFQQQDYKLDVSQSRNELFTIIPKYAVEAWEKCIPLQGTGILAWVSSADENGASITVRWAPPAGLGSLSNTDVHVDGGEIVADTYSPDETFIGETVLRIRRKVAGEQMNGLVTGSVANAQYSVGFHVPATPKWVDRNMSEEHKYGPAAVGRYRTPKFEDVAKLTLKATATAVWADGSHHWVHCVIRVDGNVMDHTGQRDVPHDGQTTATCKDIVLSIPPGRQYDIQIDTANDGARATDLTLRLDGTYRSLEAAK